MYYLCFTYMGAANFSLRQGHDYFLDVGWGPFALQADKIIFFHLYLVFYVVNFLFKIYLFKYDKLKSLTNKQE